MVVQELHLVLLMDNQVVTSLLLVLHRVKILNLMDLSPKVVVLEEVLIIITHQNQLEEMAVVAVALVDIVLVVLKLVDKAPRVKVKMVDVVVPSIILVVEEDLKIKELTPQQYLMVAME